jgi:FK506-binding protein 4/5
MTNQPTDKQTEVIPGWDVGMATMKPGERSVFTIESAMGYGDEGVGDGLIPGGATLLFDVEMIKFSK